VLVDHEKAWLALKALIADKGSHGRDTLLAEMSKLEVQHTLEEGLPERALRLYGVVFSHDLLRPAHEGPASASRDGHADLHAAGGESTDTKEQHHGEQHRHPFRADRADGHRAAVAPAAA
jgi:hypothetical protein